MVGPGPSTHKIEQQLAKLDKLDNLDKIPNPTPPWKYWLLVAISAFTLIVALLGVVIGYLAWRKPVLISTPTHATPEKPRPTPTEIQPTPK